MKAKLPTSEEFSVEALWLELRALRRQLELVTRRARRGYTHPRRSLEHEFGDDLEDALEYLDREDEEEEE